MDECAAACRANPDCGAATFMDYSWGRGCYLKRASGGWEQQASESAQSLVLCPRLAARQALEEEPLPPQLQRRRLAAFASLRPLPLPPCTFGEGLAFFGSWAGRQVGTWQMHRPPAVAWSGIPAHHSVHLPTTTLCPTLPCSAPAGWWPRSTAACQKTYTTSSGWPAATGRP